MTGSGPCAGGGARRGGGGRRGRGGRRGGGGVPAAAVFHRLRDDRIGGRCRGHRAGHEFLGLTRARQAGDHVDNPKAYLTAAITRLAIDHLSSARVRRETYVGDWLPSRSSHRQRAGPTQHAELADSLSIAFLVLLEALSPVERAVFLLRDVFGYPLPRRGEDDRQDRGQRRQIFARARQRIAAGDQAPHRAPPAPARRAEEQ